ISVREFRIWKKTNLCRIFWIMHWNLSKKGIYYGLQMMLPLNRAYPIKKLLLNILKTFNMKNQLIGPFKQLLTMRNLPLKGALQDSQLEIISNGGIYVEGEYIVEVGDYDHLREKYSEASPVVLYGEYIAVPGFIDCHTHIAFAGNRANDFALRNAGSSYLEIAA